MIVRVSIYIFIFQKPKMPYQIYDISKNLITECFQSTKTELKKWIPYDDECNHRELNVDNSLIENIYQTTGIKREIDVSSTKVQHTKYEFQKHYELCPHQDFCPITLLVYLHQDGEIKDEFYIEDKLVEEPRWNKKEDSYTALVMNSPEAEGLEHYGYFEGNGKRELLVFFLG